VSLAAPPTQGRGLGPGLPALFLLALLVQLQAGFALRGLYADGAFFATQMLARQTVYIGAGARRLSSTILEAPPLLAMEGGIRNAHLLILIFNVWIAVIPGLLFGLCYVLLPPARRLYFVFPAFAYFGGTLSAALASITEGLLATAYLWCLFILLAFGPESRLLRGAVLLLALGTLSLHEATWFLNPLLLLPCLGRWRSGTSRESRMTWGLAAVLLSLGALAGLYWTIHPFHPGTTDSFLQDVLRLSWLYIPSSGINVPAALAILAAFPILVCAAWPGMGPAAAAVFAVMALGLSAASLRVPALAVAPAQFFARDDSAFLSFGLMILCLLARRYRMLEVRLTQPAVVWVVAALGLSASLCQAGLTRRWESFAALVVHSLRTQTGIVAWPQPGATPAETRIETAMAWPWTNPDLGLILVQRRCVTSVLANQTGYKGWQPYDLSRPETLPRLPGTVYAYLLPPAAQAAACAKVAPRSSP
jgi:hypothetical protein